MKQLVETYLSIIEAEIKRQLSESSFTAPLGDAVNYAIFSGGKRIRPLLGMLLCNDLGGDTEKLMPAIVTLEYMHAASLIHDDLPALDNDDFRRGKPSCHKAFPEATAILTGDLLFTYPFEKIAALGTLSFETRIKMTECLSHTMLLLCNGQQADLNETRDCSILELYRNKTGALFAAACYFAALLSPDADKENCMEFGFKLGQYFQIVDDYIDANGGEKGRPESSDAKNHKETYIAENTPSRIDLEIFETTLLGMLQHMSIAPGKEFLGTRYIIDRVKAPLLRLQ